MDSFWMFWQARSTTSNSLLMLLAHLHARARCVENLKMIR
jgi:hypothetical protein